MADTTTARGTGAAPISDWALEQLRQGPPADRLVGWVVTLAISAAAFVLRLVGVGRPAEILFDETFYAKDAWSLLRQGYEGVWEPDPALNQRVVLGDDTALTDTVQWFVHPPLGKWLIALGEAGFGLNPFGWRIMSVVFGTLLVFMVIRLARRLARSTLVGAIAGVLVSVDGLAFVMSRVALLDIFVAFFIVAGVACLVADKDHFRHRLADHLAGLPDATLAGRAGPYIFRGWLVGAGVMFGLGCATKWNALFPLAVFGVVVVVWSLNARRLAGAGRAMWWGLVKDGLPGFVSLVVVAAVVYVATWARWLATAPQHRHRWGGPPVSDLWLTSVLGRAWGTWWQWHIATFRFHTGDQMAEVGHQYASSAWGWPLLARTSGFDAQSGIAPGDQGCPAGGDQCLRIVTALGTPALWWLGALALLIGLAGWLVLRQTRYAVAVLGFGATWVPWLVMGRGTIFSFYAVTMIPFTAIALALVLGELLKPGPAGRRRPAGLAIAGLVVLAVIANFAYFYPLYTAQLMTESQWRARIWLSGWV